MLLATEIRSCGQLCVSSLVVAHNGVAFLRLKAAQVYELEYIVVFTNMSAVLHLADAVVDESNSEPQDGSRSRPRQPRPQPH
jgi:hypothetical protein